MVSVDGSSSRFLRTDAAVFANGAQTVFGDILATYNDTTHLGAIYIKGAVVASTQNGGAFTGVFDCDRPFEVGADSQNTLYFAGQISIVFVFNAVLTAAQANRSYQRRHKRWYLDG